MYAMLAIMLCYAFPSRVPMYNILSFEVLADKTLCKF